MISIYNIRNGSIITTVTISSTASGISASQKVNILKPATLSSISLSFAEQSIYAGKSTNAVVTATYSDGTTKNVTSDSNLTGSSYLSISGSTVSSIKKIGCLGEQTVSATYGGKSISATLTVKTDFKSISLTCELYCQETRSSVSGDGSRGLTVYIPANDGGTVDFELSGTITTIFGDSYNIEVSDYVQAWYYNDLLKNGNYSSSDWMMPGDNGSVRIKYLGEEVKSFEVYF